MCVYSLCVRSKMVVMKDGNGEEGDPRSNDGRIDGARLRRSMQSEKRTSHGLSVNRIWKL